MRTPLLLRMIWNATWRIPSKNGKVVYLTFDDGPNAYVTPRVLEILEKQQVKATFFCVGENVKQNPDVFAEIKRQGHSVGNHTMHHIKGFNTTNSCYYDDIEETNKLINSTLFRPPYGRITLSQLREVKKTYHVVMWDILTCDYDKKRSPKQIVKTIKRQARNGSIIVFHDSNKAKDNVLASLEPSIEWLKGEGYEFLTL